MTAARTGRWIAAPLLIMLGFVGGVLVVQAADDAVLADPPPAIPAAPLEPGPIAPEPLAHRSGLIRPGA